MTFIARFKATGMPLKQILHYAQLRAQCSGQLKPDT